MKKLLLLGSALLLQLNGRAQLQNANFETWESPITDQIGSNRPIGWTRTNGIAGSENYNFYHSAASPAQNGNYALRLSIWYSYDKDMAKQVAPINYRPAALTGHYTYTDNQVRIDEIELDNATVSVKLTKVNPATGQPEMVGTGLLNLDAAAEFSLFTCPIAYVSNEIPDTIEVLLDCSRLDKNENWKQVVPLSTSGIGSIFTVDNLMLTMSLGTSNVAISRIDAYPNPATADFHLPNFSGDVKIYDMTGKTVATYQNVTNKIDVGSLSSGIYLISLIGEHGNQNLKLVKR